MFYYDDEVNKKEDGLELIIDVPSFTKDNLTIEIEHDELRVRGKTDKRNISRRYTLPRNVDASSVSSKLLNGQLIIDFKYKKEALPRQVMIEQG